MWNPLYYQPRRKSSTQSDGSSQPLDASPVPYASSAIFDSPSNSTHPFHESPTSSTYQGPDFRQITHQQSLPRVNEDSSIPESPSEIETGNPPLARDYASSSRYLPQTHHYGQTLSPEMEATSSQDSFRFLSQADTASTAPPRPPPKPRSPPTKSQSTPLNPELIPPASIHDEYVSKFITPIPPPGANAHTGTSNPPSTSRTRSVSSPGLQPSPLKMQDEVKPIYEIFNADLSSSGEEMVNALKGHLEDVLRVQEEIGRMHLSLEKLGPGNIPSSAFQASTPGQGSASGSNPGTPPETPPKPTTAPSSRPMSSSSHSRRFGSMGSTEPPTSSTFDDTRGKDVQESLVKREKGVDEIMERLGQLSEKLRIYHTLGTPQLSFPQSNNSPLPPTPVTAPPTATRPDHNRRKSGEPSINTTTPTHTRSKSQNRGNNNPPWSPIHPSPLRQANRQVSLAKSDIPTTGTNSSPSIDNQTSSSSFEQMKREESRESHVDPGKGEGYELPRFKLSEASPSPQKVLDAASSRQPGKVDDRSAHAKRSSRDLEQARPSSRATESDVEMLDRSRPW